MDEKGRILLNFTGEILRQQSSLQFDTTPVGRFVAKDWMGYLFIEPLFKFGKKYLAPFLLEAIGSQLDYKVIGGQHAVVEERISRKQN
jgi:hypothetical protein